METRVFSVSFGEASLFFSRVKRRDINKIKHRNDTKVLSIYIYILWNVCVIEQCIKKYIYIYTCSA